VINIERVDEEREKESSQKLEDDLALVESTVAGVSKDVVDFGKVMLFTPHPPIDESSYCPPSQHRLANPLPR